MQSRWTLSQGYCFPPDQGQRWGHFFFFLLSLHLVEVPRPGIKTVSQQRPGLLQWKLWIFNPLTTREFQDQIFDDHPLEIESWEGKKKKAGICLSSTPSCFQDWYPQDIPFQDSICNRFPFKNYPKLFYIVYNKRSLTDSFYFFFLTCQ